MSEHGSLDAATDADFALESFCPPELRSDVSKLIPLLYDDLRKVARRERVRVFSPNTLTTTALLHESFLRLSNHQSFESSTHFLRVAAITMRHLLIDRARAQKARKRGAGAVHVSLEEADELVVEDDETVLAVHSALARLSRFAPRLTQVVECRYFAGYSNAEIATALGVSQSTVERDWDSAKAWLARELGESIRGI